MTDVDQCVYGQMGARAIASRVIHRNALGLNCVVTHVSETLSNDRRIFVASNSGEITSLQFKAPSGGVVGSSRLAIGNGSSNMSNMSSCRRGMMALRDVPSSRGSVSTMGFGDF